MGCVPQNYYLVSGIFFLLWFSVFFQIFSIKHASILEIEQNAVL